jgi:hypothetical protein
MAQLPADRSKLALAQSNQVPSAVASSSRNINAMTEVYDTADMLYQFVLGLISSGTLSRLGVINAKDYATGDGTTNDTVGVQTALTAGAGGVISFPANSDFKISATLTVPDDTTIFAYGSRVFNTSTHITMLSLGNNCKVFGLELQGAGNSLYDSNGIGILINGTDSSNYKVGGTIRDCYIHGFGAYGISSEFAQNITIQDSKIYDIGYAGIGALSAISWKVDKCVIKGITPGTASNGYNVFFTRRGQQDDLTAYPRSEDCIVSNCRIEDNALWEGLDTHGGRNIRFINNYIKNVCVGIAIVSATGNGAVSKYAPQECMAIGNTVEGIGSSVGYGIIVQGNSTESAKHNIVESNKLYHCGIPNNTIGGAVHMQYSLGTIVSGNTFKECYCIGVVIYINNIGAVVSGNSFVDVNDSIYTDPSCIALPSTGNEVAISGNSFIRSNTGVNTYVGLIGINFIAISNTIMVVGNYNNCTFAINSGVGRQGIHYGELLNGRYSFVSNGSPEGVITAVVGSSCSDSSGNVYSKTSGTGNTGWSLMNGAYLTSIAAAPSYIRQEALVAGVWYKAIGTSSTSDWKALN